MTMLRIDQRVFKDPADPRRIRAEFCPDALRQSRQHALEVLQRSRTRPVDIRAFLKNDVHEGIAEIRKSAHGFYSRRAEHRRDDRIRDLVLDNIRTAVPSRVDNYLRVAEVR